MMLFSLSFGNTTLISAPAGTRTMKLLHAFSCFLFFFQFIINIKCNFLNVYKRNNNFYFDNSSNYLIHVNYKVGFLNQTSL